MKIAIAADHAGFEYKDRIAVWLREHGHTVFDYGTENATPVDYPQYGFVVGLAVAGGKADRGIVVCGSSIGISIAANKIPNVRCAPVAEPLSAELARRHNDANVIAIAERLTGWEMVERLLEVFLNTPFDGGRHLHRVEQLGSFTSEQQARTQLALTAGHVNDAQTPAALL